MSGVLLEPVELRAKGFEALVGALGWVNAVRFLQQYEKSSLDYTRERREGKGQASLAGRSAVGRREQQCH